jgi:hypothetical protein
MRQEFTLFISTFTMLLAILNPLEALPIFLKLLDGKACSALTASKRPSIKRRMPPRAPTLVKAG